MKEHAEKVMNTEEKSVQEKAQEKAQEKPSDAKKVVYPGENEKRNKLGPWSQNNHNTREDPNVF